MTKRILHVDYNHFWHKLLREAITIRGMGIEIESFGSLESAKIADKTNKYDAYIVEASIKDERDGLVWVSILIKNGKKAVVFAGIDISPFSHLPFISKSDSHLVEKICELVNE